MNDNNQDTEKRAYWARKLDEAHDFMMRVMQVRIRDCREPLESLRDGAEDAGVQVYFSDSPFAHTFTRQHYLRRELIPYFIAAAREMNDRGWIMKVEDAYRTPEMQKALQRTPELFDMLLKTLLWETGGQSPPSCGGMALSSIRGNSGITTSRMLTIRSCPVIRRWPAMVPSFGTQQPRNWSPSRTPTSASTATTKLRTRCGNP